MNTDKKSRFSPALASWCATLGKNQGRQLVPTVPAGMPAATLRVDLFGGDANIPVVGRTFLSVAAAKGVGNPNSDPELRVIDPQVVRFLSCGSARS